MAHKKRDDHPEEKEVNLGIVITPMLDMAFQLLAFFVLTYHPAALEGHINGKLLPPSVAIQSKGAATKEAKVETKTDVLESDTDTVTILIRSANQDEGTGDTKRIEGQPSQLLIRTPQEPGKEETIADSSDSLNTGLKKLFTRLKEMRSKDLASVARLQPDRNLRHEYVVRTWNVCRTAGFETIGFVAPPKVNER